MRTFYDEGSTEARGRFGVVDPPDLDKLSELLIRMALQQSGSCRSEDATRPKGPRASAGSSS